MPSEPNPIEATLRLAITKAHQATTQEDREQAAYEIRKIETQSPETIRAQRATWAQLKETLEEKIDEILDQKTWTPETKAELATLSQKKSWLDTALEVTPGGTPKPSVETIVAKEHQRRARKSLTAAAAEALTHLPSQKPEDVIDAFMEGILENPETAKDAEKLLAQALTARTSPEEAQSFLQSLAPKTRRPTLRYRGRDICTVDGQPFYRSVSQKGKWLPFNGIRPIWNGKKLVERLDKSAFTDLPANNPLYGYGSQENHNRALALDKENIPEGTTETPSPEAVNSAIGREEWNKQWEMLRNAKSLPKFTPPPKKPSKQKPLALRIFRSLLEKGLAWEDKLSRAPWESQPTPPSR